MNICRLILLVGLVVVIGLTSIGVTQKPTSLESSAASTKLSLIVTNSSNHSIDEVRKEQVQIFQDGVPQILSRFERDDRQIDYAVAIDNSGSFKSVLKSAMLASRMIIDSNRPSDETFLERFISNGKIETVQEFTADKAMLISKLDDRYRYLYIESGQSAVVDALYVAVEHTAKYRPYENRRKAVVVFTDCEERSSYYSTDKLIKLIRETNVQIFVVAVLEFLSKGTDSITGIKNSRGKAEKFARRIAEESGGRFFFPTDGKEMKFAVDEIVHDLHSEFLVGYERTSINGKTQPKITVSISTKPADEPLTAIVRVLH